MTDTTNLALPLIEGAQAQKHITHNEALRILDTLVQLAVLDRDLNVPSASPSEGQRWIVKASPAPTGAWANHANQIAAWQDAAWQFSPPKIGWIAYVVDEGVLLAWNGTAWVDALAILSAWQNLTLLGIGTSADAGNPFSAKLNNTLFAAKTVSEGGTGDLRYKLSKESAAKVLSFLFQDNFSGRAEIGLTGDDDLHVKVSADGSTWVEALVLDRTTGGARFSSQFLLSGDITPPQITSDQNDYNPTGLSAASVLRVNANASRNITGLQGGADGRVITIINVGANPIVLKNADTGSGAANRFLFGADLTLAAEQAVSLWYDSTSGRWRSEGRIGAQVFASVAMGALTATTGAFSGALSTTTGLFSSGATQEVVQLTGSGNNAYIRINNTAAGGRDFLIASGATASAGGPNSLFIFDNTAGVTRLKIDSSGNTAFGGQALPSVDNTYSLGNASFRWSQLYAGTTTINTSDARDKTELSEPPQALLDAILTVPIGQYQWLDSVAKKGADKARLHFGPTAQAVRDAILAKGLDPNRFALFCQDPKLIEVTKTRMVRRTVPPAVEMVEKIVIEDGRAVRKPVPQERVVTEVLPVHDEAGNEIPDLTVEVPKTELVEEGYTALEEVPGEFVYGLRLEQFYALLGLAIRRKVGM